MSVTDTTEDFWAFKYRQSRESPWWHDPKTHLRSYGKALCGAQVPDSRLTKKKRYVDCKACIAILKPIFPHCEICLFSQTCKICLSKRQVHANWCSLSKGNHNLPYLEFLVHPNRCSECLTNMTPHCDCVGLTKVNIHGLKVSLNSSPMVLRRNHKDGTLFWGCSNYPDCKKTKRI